MLFKILTLILSFQFSFAIEPIHFSAKIKDEKLAEETILLLHCLADNANTEWQINENLGKHYLIAFEKNNEVNGRYVQNEKNREFNLKPGKAEEICLSLSTNGPKIAAIESSNPPFFESTAPLIEQDSKKSYKWWVGGAAILLGGFFLWKSQQPDHKYIHLN